jgi:metal transporter CNNM
MAPSVGEELGSPEFWGKMIISIFLVLLGGVFSGLVHFYVCVAENKCMPMNTPSPRDRLTLGLMGLDELHLRVLSTSSEDQTERKNAAQGTPQTPAALGLGLLRQIQIFDPLSLVLKLLNKGRHWVLVVSGQRFPVRSCFSDVRTMTGLAPRKRRAYHTK